MSFLDSLGSNLLNALTWVIELLPDSPFIAISNEPVQEYMGAFNWFFPISQIVAELELWLVCVSIFYVYQLILRWVRAID